MTPRPLSSASWLTSRNLHRNTGIGEAHGDAAAHQAAADGRRRGDVLARRLARHVWNARRLPLGEEDVDHGRPLLVLEAALEVGAFGADAVVEIVERHRRLHGVEGHAAVELTAHPARKIRLAGFEDVGIGAIGKHLVALLADQRVRALAGPVLAVGDRVIDEVAIGDAIDDAQFKRLAGVERIPGENGLHRLLRADQPRQPLGAAAARQQADLDLRQTDGGAGRGDAVVAGQRQFEAAAERRAVDRGDDGLGAAFDQFASGLFRLLVGIRRLAEIADVGTGDERPALAGDDDGLDSVVGECRFQMLRQIETHAGTHRVDRRIVDRQERGAVAHLVMHGA